MQAKCKLYILEEIDELLSLIDGIRLPLICFVGNFG
jgi:hypothetical protein